MEAWVTHLVRTLKTCRLYDVNNPTVVRFREELVSGLHELLSKRGGLTLEVTSTQLLCEGVPVYVSRSRDENLAGACHRDGIRTLGFLAGIGAGEVETFLDEILHVTGPSAGEDDLVTLLWQADLPNIAITAVPLEGDVEGGGEDGAETASPIGWPTGAGIPPSGATGSSPDGSSDAGDTERSDDWSVLARASDLDQAFDELESSALEQMARLQQEYEAELGTSLVVRSLGTLVDCLAAQTTPHDREEVARLLPRLMREAILTGDWISAGEALTQLRRCDPEWSPIVFLEGLTGNTSAIRKAVQALDEQEEAGVEACLTFARALGTDASEWLMSMLAESQQRRTRRPLARTIAELIREHPERLLPWMSDERWYVVRNVVHILGWIGGDRVSSLLKAATQHPEVRVRREVVAALGTASPEVARPILLGMLGNAESRLFAAILQQLSQASDASVIQRLEEMIRDDRFPERSDDDRRAVFMTLADHGDQAVAVLEEELKRGGLFTHGLDSHWQSVALCLARIGTPAARGALESGTRAQKAGVRKACEQALDSIGARQ